MKRNLEITRTDQSVNQFSHSVVWSSPQCKPFSRVSSTLPPSRSSPVYSWSRKYIQPWSSIFAVCLHFIVWSLIFLFRYSTAYTMLPVFSLVVDRDVTATNALTYPELYKVMKGRGLGQPWIDIDLIILWLSTYLPIGNIRTAVLAGSRKGAESVVQDILHLGVDIIVPGSGDHVWSHYLLRSGKEEERDNGDWPRGGGGITMITVIHLSSGFPAHRFHHFLCSDHHWTHYGRHDDTHLALGYARCTGTVSYGSYGSREVL